jgi:hypothetical protein
MRPFGRLPQLISIGLLSSVGLPVSGSADPSVELVTIGSDHAIDTRFGHVLLRVVDPEFRSAIPSGSRDVASESKGFARSPVRAGRGWPPCCTVRVP